MAGNGAVEDIGPFRDAAQLRAGRVTCWYIHIDVESIDSERMAHIRATQSYGDLVSRIKGNPSRIELERTGGHLNDAVRWTGWPAAIIFTGCEKARGEGGDENTCDSFHNSGFFTFVK